MANIANLYGKVRHKFVNLSRAATGHDQRLIRAYLAGHPVRKLQIGTGENFLPDWLNSDLHPLDPRMIHLSAIRRFPFADGTFDYVFSEHMIEHIPFEPGLFMLKECCRVLKPGGRIRIATPDLGFLLALFRTPRSEVQERYIQWSLRSFFPAALGQEETYVLNHFVRGWGHQFIYDERVLGAALGSAGFTDVVRRGLNQSDDPNLRGLENERRMEPGFLALETLAMEGVKARAPS
jgi:predicted SAM-dependent methyltransferase